MRRVRIGLLWHSVNSGNLGVGALTAANLAIVTAVAAKLGLEPRFVVIGMRDDGERYIPESQSAVYALDTRTLLSPGGCWREIGAQDCIIDIGSGDSFADIYGIKRFLYLWLTKMFAIARRRPLLLAPQTIGPFTTFATRRLARMPLRGARLVFARDKLSRDAAAALAPRAATRLSVDVAFALPYVDRSAERGGPDCQVGVNVSGLLFEEAESGRNRFGLSMDYAHFTRRLLAELSARPNLRVHLINHVASLAPGRDDDVPVSERLRAEFPGVVCAPRFASPSEAKSYISGLDFLVAGRMHACIAAYSSGTPVVPIAYSRKFGGLFGMLDYRWIVPPQGYSADGALAFVLECLGRRDELRNDIAAGMLEVGALLDEYRRGLESFLSEAAGL